MIPASEALSAFLAMVGALLAVAWPVAWLNVRGTDVRTPHAWFAGALLACAAGLVLLATPVSD